MQQYAKANAALRLVFVETGRNWRLCVLLSKKLGVLYSFREESSMSEAPISAGPSTISQQIQVKLAELAELVSLEQYGPGGPPKDLTFREIENTGYQVAQLAAAKFEATTTQAHQQQHFTGTQSCPQCGIDCEAEGSAERRLLTRLGPVDLSEIKFHCNACRRSFFPAA